MPDNFRETYPHTAELYIDSIDVLFPGRYFAKDTFKVHNWAKKYLNCSKYGDDSNILRNMINLDFSYNDLVINESGIFKKSFDKQNWEFYMTINNYEKTFYVRVETLRNQLRDEFLFFPFNKLNKEKISSILQKEMDFFYMDLIE